MVQAKTDMKARTRELRRAGKTYDEIVAELGVSKGLAMHILDGADLYRRIEGWWYGIVLGSRSTA
ncbi:hypothetical protein ACH4U6_18090 [Streptomyces netropsis]|uniref:hypothetical protein n=1 Tax=Streptomyces netropsis TaxID=55404 RepID=UPI0037ABCDA9